MTPFELQILLHYYGCADDFRGGDFSAPALRDTLSNFCGPLDLLTRLFGDKITHATYEITARGRVYVEALLTIPLPVQVWEMPTPPYQRGLEKRNV